MALVTKRNVFHHQKMWICCFSAVTSSTSLDLSSTVQLTSLEDAQPISNDSMVAAVDRLVDLLVGVDVGVCFSSPLLSLFLVVFFSLFVGSG